MKKILMIILILSASQASFANQAAGDQVFWATQIPGTRSGMLESINEYNCDSYSRTLLVVQAPQRGMGLFKKFFNFYSMPESQIDPNCPSHIHESDLHGEVTIGRGKWKQKLNLTLTRLGKKLPCPTDVCEPNSNTLFRSLRFADTDASEEVDVERVEFFDGGYVAFGGTHRCYISDEEREQGLVDFQGPYCGDDQRVEWGRVMKIDVTKDLKTEFLRAAGQE